VPALLFSFLKWKNLVFAAKARILESLYSVSLRHRKRAGNQKNEH